MILKIFTGLQVLYIFPKTGEKSVPRQIGYEHTAAPRDAVKNSAAPNCQDVLVYDNQRGI